MDSMSAGEAAAALVNPAAYADGRLERACDTLRLTSPVHRVDVEGFLPFFVLTKYHDVQEVERNPARFIAAPRYRLRREQDDLRGEAVRSLVSMDPPDHTEYRSLAADWFHPHNLNVFDDSVRALARAAVDGMAARSESYDFVTKVSMQLPLTVICSMLGIPESDRDLILRLTQLAFGSEDAEYRERAQVDGVESGVRFAQYFAEVARDRLAHPTDDLSSLLAHAQLHGEPLPPGDLLGYFGILATAGHDTTSSTIAGGLEALVEHPDQLERLRDDPSLVPAAVEEMIRWVTPVKSFMRTAVEDTELRGQRLSAGDAVLLLYASANRDEDVFEDPYRFDVARDPNRHLAFGHGIHFCLGAQLARLETRAFFAELIPRLRSIEITGVPELVKTLFVGGLKHLPIRAHVD
jgi:cytochrome P450